MYILKGFMSYGKLHDNNVGITSPIGEISTNALTYAKEKGFYNKSSAPNSGLISFYSFYTEEDSLIKVPVSISDVVLDIGEWFYSNAISGTLTSNQNLVSQLFLNVFNSSIVDFKIGAMVTNGTNWLPEWIEFKVTTTDQYSDNIVKIWFSNNSFEQQYDEYEIEFVAPITNLDDFFKNALQVKSLVDAVSLTDLMLKVETVKEKNPYTFLKSSKYDYHDYLDFDWTYPTNWTVMLYGIAGNNVDVIKRELQKWILERSNYGVEDWKKVFPDIFTNTEFIITPLWDQYSVPNRTIQAGVYSPTTEFFRIAAIANKTCVGDNYNTTHVLNNTSISSSMYKSIQFLSCGGPDNRGGITKLYDQFTDYMAVSSTSGDFNRMSLRTQNWIFFLTELFIVAENMTEHSVMPIGTSRLFREGNMYAVGTYEDVQYLVVAKRTIDEASNLPIPPIDYPIADPDEEDDNTVYLTGIGDDLLMDQTGKLLTK